MFPLKWSVRSCMQATSSDEFKPGAQSGVHELPQSISHSYLHGFSRHDSHAYTQENSWSTYASVSGTTTISFRDQASWDKCSYTSQGTKGTHTTMNIDHICSSGEEKMTCKCAPTWLWCAFGPHYEKNERSRFISSSCLMYLVLAPTRRLPFELQHRTRRHCYSGIADVTRCGHVLRSSTPSFSFTFLWFSDC